VSNVRTVIIAIILIYAVSLEFQLSACIVIHNHCLNTELVSPVYYSYGAVCSKLFDQQIDIDTEVRTSFKINTIENKFEYALLFKLKKHVESGDQQNIDASTTETDENEATHVHMLVIWKVKDVKSFAYVTLVEHDKEFTWNEDKLKKLYYENRDRLKDHTNAISNTWLVDGSMILKTRFKIKGSKRNPKLSIHISEEKKGDHAMKPSCINLER
jgi:hypothetical protein